MVLNSSRSSRERNLKIHLRSSIFLANLCRDYKFSFTTYEEHFFVFALCGGIKIHFSLTKNLVHRLTTCNELCSSGSASFCGGEVEAFRKNTISFHLKNISSSSSCHLCREHWKHFLVASFKSFDIFCCQIVNDRKGFFVGFVRLRTEKLKAFQLAKKQKTKKKLKSQSQVKSNQWRPLCDQSGFYSDKKNMERNETKCKVNRELSVERGIQRISFQLLKDVIKEISRKFPCYGAKWLIKNITISILKLKQKSITCWFSLHLNFQIFFLLHFSKFDLFLNNFSFLKIHPNHCIFPFFYHSTKLFYTFPSSFLFRE